MDATPGIGTQPKKVTQRARNGLCATIHSRPLANTVVRALFVALRGKTWETNWAADFSKITCKAD